MRLPCLVGKRGRSSGAVSTRPAARRVKQPKLRLAAIAQAAALVKR